jgi:hypothetical protein
MEIDKDMMRLEDRNTMYNDMVKILKKTGLADFIQAESERKNSGLNAGMDRSISDMMDRGKFIGVDKKKSKRDYLKRGRFYLASFGQDENSWAVFYVNPVDWFQKNSIGLVYIGWDGLLRLLKNPEENPMTVSNKGWNSGLSDIAAVEDYRELVERNRIIAKAEVLEESYDFFREEGYTFYELPNMRPVTELGVFNWWW